MSVDILTSLIVASFFFIVLFSVGVFLQGFKDTLKAFSVLGGAFIITIGIVLAGEQLAEYILNG